MKKRKLLINGAGRGCLGLTQTAKQMGLYVIVTGMDGPCIPLADVAYRDVHPGHPEEVLEVAQKEHIDGITTSCNDMGLPAVGYCCDHLGLTGLSYESAMLCANKLAMKQRLTANGVRTANFRLVHNPDELLQATNELTLPVIIKATDLQGSRGICIVKEKSGLVQAYEDVMSLTHKDYCIVEEFIEGVEFGAQAFVSHGKVLFVLPHGDETLLSKTAVPVGHYMPYEMSDELKADVEVQARSAIGAMCLDDCAVNIDFISRDNEAYIIELTGRGGANGLTDITGKYFCINYYEMMIAAALGDRPEAVYENSLKNSRAAVSKMLTSQESGRVKCMTIPVIPDTEITMFISEGDDVRAFTNSNDDIGQIIVSGDDLVDCNNKIDLVVQSLRVELTKGGQ